MSITRPQLLLLLLFAITLSHVPDVVASVGDRLPPFRACVTNCVLARQNKDDLSLILKLMQWTLKDDCQYQCMFSVLDTIPQVYQFYGKWPFTRLLGMQEPASVLFSILNGLVHFHFYRRLQQAMPATYSLRAVYLATPIVALNTWLWSSVFHMRDKPLTEKLDYFSAGGYILYCLFLGLVRIFRIHRYGLLATLCLVLFTAHCAYLSTADGFDYGYNMKACITVGTLQTSLWLFWSILQYTDAFGDPVRRPFAWRAGLSVVLISLAMALEVFDFPPWLFIIDAHSLWHASTVFITPLFYSFLLKDIQVDVGYTRSSKTLD